MKGLRALKPTRILFLALLGACASGQHQAPFEDRSTELERQRPAIVRDGETVVAGSVQSRNERTATRTENEDVSSTEGGSATSTASGTVVRGAAISSGISRRSLESRPLESRREADGSSPSEPSVHTVDRGDTLYSIAWMHGMDYRRLAIANDLTPPYTIYPGQQLVLDDGDISRTAIDALPEIPPAPAGGEAAGRGDRPSAAMNARRTGSVEQRSRDGVSWQWPGDGTLTGRYDSASRGIDLSASPGDPVYAAADGDVVYAGRGIQGAGDLVILRHSARHLSAYMHNSTMLVSEGDRIRGGDKIAESGTTPDGRSLLHFEIRVDGQPVDPSGFLPSR